MNLNLYKMTDKDKELLIKDICSRLPYDLVIDYNGIRTTLHDIKVFQLYDSDDIKDYNCLIDIFRDDDYVDVENIKPYLFPLSSMTEEQKIIYGDFCYAIIHSLAWDMQTELNDLIDWFNKNHFDYRGLIEKGLAIDATGLNIY